MRGGKREYESRVAKVAQGNLPNKGPKQNHYRVTKRKRRIGLKVHFGGSGVYNELRKLECYPE